jgi:anaerobic selenocysteine-containing dehydrogenase
METRHTFCRICEAACGLVAQVDRGRVVSLAPAPGHIGTEGFACMKGLNQHRIYDAPDRLRQPLKRVGNDWQPIGWRQALAEIGAKVRVLQAQSRQSTAMYVGTAAGFSILHPIFAQGFMQGLGSRNVYSSATQDCANRFASATEMYGSPMTQPFVDLDHVECMIVVGTNPAVSKWTFLQVAHPNRRIKEIVARGGQAIFVDPRETESARLGSRHLFIRPGTDVYFFLSLLHEVFAQGGVDERRVATHMQGLEALRRLAQAWPPERTAAATAIAPEALRRLAGDYLRANGAAIVTGTGIGQGPHGTLAHWLAEAINAITGNLDRRGGLLVGRGIVDFPGYCKKQGVFDVAERSRIGGFRQINGGYPGGILADEILTPGQDQVRALFVSGGNPLLTMANSARLREALTQLELLVVTDIQLSETASLAHYVLPAVSPLQRPDLPFVFPLFLGMQAKPYIAATEALVEPEGEQWDEATIYTELAAACGVSLFGSRVVQAAMRAAIVAHRWFGRGHNRGVPQRLILDQMLRRSGVGNFAALLRHVDGQPRPGARADDYLGKRVLTDDGRVQLAPPAFVARASQLDDDLVAERAAIERGELRLISKRAHATHNSWTQNIAELTEKSGDSNYLYMHPADAAARGLSEGACAEVATPVAAIRLPVKLLPELMPGAVAIPHGWGHQSARGLSVAARLGGANVNLLFADGPANTDPLSGMSRLTAVEVRVRAVDRLDPGDWSGVPA